MSIRTNEPRPSRGMRFTLRARLYVVAVIALAIIGFTGSWSIFRLGAISKQTQTTVQSINQLNQELANLKTAIDDRQTYANQLIFQTDPRVWSRSITDITASNAFIEKQLSDLQNRFPNAFADNLGEGMKLIKAAGLQTAGVNEAAQARSFAGDSVGSSELPPYLTEKISADYLKLSQALDAFKQSQTLAITAQINGAQSVIWREQLALAFAVFLGILLVGALPFYLFGESFRFIGRIAHGLERLKHGEISDEKLPSHSNEIGVIAEGVNKASENLEKAAQFANEVGQGRFNSDYQAAGENDVLGAALVNMRDRLKAVADEEAQRNWAIAGFARFGEILRANTSLGEFADSIIQNLARYINALQGAFFVVQQNEDGKTELEMVSSYAYERKRFLTNKFQLGEGVVGQAAQEKGVIYLNDIPANYISITSGLGEAKPTCVLVVPMIHNDEVYGVLEFAAFHSFERHTIEFVEKLAENIASTLTNVKNNERTVRLLQETQSMTEQLRASEEETRQNMEELTATHEEMGRIQLELQGQIRAINNSAIVSEADLKGDIIFANEEFLRVSKYSRDEMLGRNHRMLKSGHQPQELFDDLWATVSRGRVWKGEVKNRAKDGSYYWVSATITPILDKDGKPLKYVGVRFEITEQKLQAAQIQAALEEAQAQEEEIRQNSEELSATQEEMRRVNLEFEGQLKAINRSMATIEFDMNGKILKANDIFLQLSGYRSDEIIGQHHRIFVEPAESKSDEYRQFWEKLNAGEFLRNEYKRVKRNGDIFYILGSYNPIFGSDGLPYKVVKYAIDVTENKHKDAELNKILEETMAQEEELRQNAEEMAATQEEIKRVNIEFDGQLKAINRSMATIEFDMNGKILKANDIFLQLSGYRSDEIIGQHHRIFVEPAEANSEGYRLFWLKLNNGEFSRNEFKRVKRSGEFFYILGSYNPIFGSDGHPYKVVKYAIDITDSKIQEEKLRSILEETQAQEEELRQNAEEMDATQEEMGRLQIELTGQVGALNNAALVSEADLIGNIIFANDEFCRVAQYSRNELLGQNHRLLKSGLQSQEIFIDLWRTISSGKVWRGEIMNRAKDGSYYWVKSTITPILGQDGKPVKYVGVRFEISEQKRQQAELEILLQDAQLQSDETQAHLNALNFTNAVIEFDLDGRILSANENFLLLSGYTLDEIKGRHHRILVDSEQASKAEYRMFWDELQNGNSQKGEFQRINKNGKPFWIVGSYLPIKNKDGKLYKVLKISTDITASKI